VAEQTVEGVQNAGDGTSWDLGIPREWTPLVDVANRDRDPKEGSFTTPAGVKGARSGSDSAGERKLTRG